MFFLINQLNISQLKIALRLIINEYSFDDQHCSFTLPNEKIFHIKTFNVMYKKTLLLLTIIMCFAFTGFAQEWQVYDGSVLPDANDPALTQSNWSDPGPTNTVTDDPDISGNKYLEYISDGTDMSGLWTQEFSGDVPSKVTMVARVKAADVSTYDKVLEMDFRFNGLREKLVISGDNEIELQRAGKDIVPDNLDVSEWNIYRFTFDTETGAGAVYINESSVPVLTATSTESHTSNYIRFGDGSGSNTYGALVDWVVWDTTGTYNPKEEVLDQTLTGIGGDWMTYTASVLPDANAPAFEQSNWSDPGPTNTIIDDPDISGNQLLEYLSDGVDMSGLWAQTYTTENMPSEVTMVVRVKAADIATYDKVLDLDFRFGSLREKLVISNNNEVELQRAGVDIVPDNLDVSKWNIYRFTFNAETGDGAVYINESNVPTLTATSTEEHTSNYIRFGDGSGSNTYGALVDWVVWDTTGTYSPADKSISNALTGAGGASSKSIVFVANENNTYPKTGEPRDKPFIDTLKNIGYNVKVVYNSYLSFATENELSTYNNADLVIIGRSGSSGDFGGINRTTWNGIQAPVLNMSSWTTRDKANKNRLNWFNSDNSTNVDVSLDAVFTSKVLKPDDEAFSDVDMPADSVLDWFIGPYSAIIVPEDTATNANVLVRSNVDSVDAIMMARFDTGVPFYENAGDSAAAPRSYFGVGNDDTTYFNLSDDALNIWLKEVELMANKTNYTPLEFPSANAGLSDVLLDGTSIQGFESTVFEYEEPVSGVPEVTATTIADGATTNITQASSIPGEATIEVTAPDGETMVTYTLNFVSADATGPKIMFVGDDGGSSGGVADGIIMDKLREWGYRVTYVDHDTYRDNTPDHSEYDMVYFSESMSSQRTATFADAGFPLPAFITELSAVQASEGRMDIGDNGDPLDDSDNEVIVKDLKIIEDSHPIIEGTSWSLNDEVNLYSGDIKQGWVDIRGEFNFTNLGEISGFDGETSWVAIEPSGKLEHKMVLFGAFDGAAETATEDYWQITQRSILWLLDSLGGETLTSVEDLNMEDNALVAYPNPSSNMANLKFKMKEAGRVNLAVYNSIGRKVDILTDKVYSQGEHKLEFNTRNYANGIYIFKMRKGNTEETFKMLIEH